MIDETDAMTDLVPDPVPSVIDGTDRSRYLGGYDLAVTLGYSHWTTPLKLQMLKLGEIPPDEPNSAMELGTLLEPYIADAYAFRFKKELVTPAFVQHPQYPFLGGHPDRVADDGTLIEIKAPWELSGEYGAPESDEIPDDYQVQVQDYAGLLHLNGHPIEKANLVTLPLSSMEMRTLLGWMLKVMLDSKEKQAFIEYLAAHIVRFCIERKPAVFGFLVQHGVKWWTNHIVERKRIEPRTPEEAVLQSLAWADVKGKTLALNSCLRETFESFMEARRQEKAWGKRKDNYKVDIVSAMDLATADTLIDPEKEGSVVATWRSNPKKLIDIKRLWSEAPEIAARFAMPKIERKFLPKGEKE